MPNQISPPVIDASQHYSNLRSEVAALLLSEHEGMEISLMGSALANNKLLAMTGGVLHFEPGTNTPARLVLQIIPGTSAIIRDRTPQGIPAPEHIIYVDVDPAGVKQAMRSVISNTSTAILDKIWKTAGNSTMPVNLQEAVLEIFMHEVSLPTGYMPTLAVTAGTHIGAAITHANRAVFTLQMLDAGGNKITPEAYIQLLPTIDSKPRYENHPLITQMMGIEPQPTEIFLCLEVYDLNQHQHIPIPNIPVSVIEPGTILNRNLKTATTQSDGTVSFNFPADATLQGKSFFFEADLSTLGSFAGHSNLPNKWQTAGWLAVDNNTQGYQNNFQGFRIGANGNPATFRVGVDVHVKVVRYETDNDFNNKTNPIPIYPGTTIQLHNDSSTLLEVNVINGVAHGVIFDMEGRDELTISGYYRIDVPKLHAIAVEALPKKLDMYKSTHLEASLQQTSIGAHSRPKTLNPPNKFSNAILFELKTLLELVNFLDEITGGTSTPLRGSSTGSRNPMVVTHKIIDALNNVSNSMSVQPFAFPKRFIHLRSHSLSSAQSIERQRKTIFHETTHQVTYFEADLSRLLIGPGALLISEAANISLELENKIRDTLGIDPVGYYNFGNHLVHGNDYLTNPRATLVEAYPEFMAQILSYDWGNANANPTPPVGLNRDSSLQVRQGAGFTRDPNEKLGPLPSGSPHNGPPGNGINVEGAVVNALFHIFIYEVIDPVISIGNFTPPMLPPTIDGDVVSNSPNNWVSNTQIQDRFQRMLWKPMTDLDQESGPLTMKTVLTLMQAGNPSDWHRILRWLHCWNIHMIGPTIVSVSLTAGSWNTSHTLTLEGTNFVFDNTVIAIYKDANPTSPIAFSTLRVTSSTQIEIDLPGHSTRETVKIECTVNQQISPHLTTRPATYPVGKVLTIFSYT